MQLKKDFLEYEEIDVYEPERNLLAAVLDRAIMDMWVKEDRATRRSAQGWIKARTKKRSRKWSFQWVCEHLDLEPETMREIILNLDMEQYKRHR